ncbi:hypothetical protein CBR_g21952 [Chara braunii]|uniref:Cysteine protease n=1 Tax=Chara braunii TaxID=69332 RepID=A0A388L1X9_CHABU|nr:hypothetical protein CBR_g21952 [Chara braunii]|eukprot:GBG76203.1 hypothetical protein CBR_g21952 [Chara braunii]
MYFKPLGVNKLTSDAGWGCMLRSGQMMLAQALLCHYLGRQWRRDTKAGEYLSIVRSFGDDDSGDCPFSIHNLIAAGKPHGLAPGSWLGPYALCRSIEALSLTENGQSALPMTVYVVAGDAEGERGGAPVLCTSDAEDLCRQRLLNSSGGSGMPVVCAQKDAAEQRGGMEHNATEHWADRGFSKSDVEEAEGCENRDVHGRSAEVGDNEGEGSNHEKSSLDDWGPLLVLVPLVLGVDKVNLRYLPSLKILFTFPQTLGILGGKPGASTYLVGYQGDHALYLDPHEVQQVVNITVDDLDTDTSSYHCG